jgi:predicted secreted Zn-dependent protease
MTDDNAVRVHLATTHYRVVGSTWVALRRALAVAGPRRDGIVYAAYTDWRVRWVIEPVARDGTWRPKAVHVDVDAALTLPEWRPPRLAASALRERWRRYDEELASHERGHVAIAEQAGAAVAVALRRLAPCGSEQALQREAQSVASATIERFRRVERRYDSSCQHIANG